MQLSKWQLGTENLKCFDYEIININKVEDDVVDCVTVQDKKSTDDNININKVEDDVVDCVTVQDEQCNEETVGYTTQTKCQQWPR